MLKSIINKVLKRTKKSLQDKLFSGLVKKAQRRSKERLNFIGVDKRGDIFHIAVNSNVRERIFLYDGKTVQQKKGLLKDLNWTIEDIVNLSKMVKEEDVCIH